MKTGYLIALLMILLGFAVLFTDGFGVLNHSTQFALGLMVVSLVITTWQKEHDPRHSQRRDPSEAPRR